MLMSVLVGLLLGSGAVYLIEPLTPGGTLLLVLLTTLLTAVLSAFGRRCLRLAKGPNAPA